MRIVGGRHRGRSLVGPSDQSIRPTTDRARQALFNILEHGTFAKDGSPIAGQRVLDVFAGTGALGLEALSRGAAHASFIERRPNLVSANVAALGESERTTILAIDARLPPKATLPVSLAFLDPPYREGLAALVLPLLHARGWLATGALVVLEIAADEMFDAPLGFVSIDRRRYGAASIVFLSCEGRTRSCR